MDGWLYSTLGERGQIHLFDKLKGALVMVFCFGACIRAYFGAGWEGERKYIYVYIYRL